MNKCSVSLCSGISKAVTSTECGVASPPSPFKVWQDSQGIVSVYNQKHEDVKEYFDVSIVDGTVVMSYKKTPTLDEWRKIVGK